MGAQDAEVKEMVEKASDCGTKPCTEVVDRLGKMLSDQQEKGFQSIKELMGVHHEMLKSEIADIKRTVKDQGDEIFPRLRKVEERLKVVEVKDITEDKVKEIVADNETVKWTARRRSFERAVAKTMVATIALTLIGIGIDMYVEYQKSKSVPKVESPRGAK